MTDHESTSPASTEPAALDFAVGADRIDAYITSVEQVLLAARVPATERVQILGDLETQITEMLGNEPLPISEATVAAVISRLEPPSHFAATYAGESSAQASPVQFHATVRYSPWVLAAAGSCLMFIISCFLLMLCASEHVAPPVTMFILLSMLCCAIATPLATRKGFSQLRAEPKQYLGAGLAAGTTMVYWTVLPALLLLFVSALTDGYVLYPIAIGSFAYFQYVLIRRHFRRLTGEVLAPNSSDSLAASLRAFARAGRPAVGL